MTDRLFDQQEVRDPLYHEKEAMARGYKIVAGVDEAGRGPLAGPVVAAAVVLKPGTLIEGVRDSKKLTSRRREQLFDAILAEALAVGVGISNHETIDRVNILQASLLAMKKAIQKLSEPPDFLLVDGTFKVPMRLAQATLIKGDDVSMSIGAASIVAKVTRDRLMAQYDSRFPGYGFAEHKGYACSMHLEAIARLGPCAIHRKTFSGVKEYLKDPESDQVVLPFGG